ncbi:MAG: glycosyltransferase family 2 protein [Pirellulaceae bacterium]|nr:glycosyltransferase family 2 protein [Pirellulaceae bacterium]
MRHKLSVMIPCKNEQENILSCIESVRAIADEIVVADSGSEDNTLPLVEELGFCRVIKREYVDAGNFKNWVIPQMTHEWVLTIDADERVTPALAAEIQNTLTDEKSQNGYWIYRNNHFMGHPLRHTSWGQDRVIRLFRRDVGRYREYTDHSEITMPADQVGFLKERLTHYTCWDYDNYLQKMLRYTDQQAKIWYQEGRKPSLFRLFCNGPLRFFRCYVVQRGFLDGLAGFQVSALTGFYSFMKQARLWHMHHARHRSELETQ